MPKLSEQARRERIERILDGARRCFARHGYEGATVSRLEEEIGLSRGAIFNWFSSKEELFVALASRDNERLLRLFADEGFEPLVRAMTEEDADWLAVYLEFGRRFRSDPEFRRRWQEERSPADVRRRVDERIEAEQRAGRLRSDLTISEIGRFLGLVLDGIVTQRGLGFEAPDPDLVVRLVGDALRERARVSPRARPRRRSGTPPAA